MHIALEHGYKLPITLMVVYTQVVERRKNFTGKGFTYDSSADAFYAPKPYEYIGHLIPQHICDCKIQLMEKFILGMKKPHLGMQLNK